MVDTCLDLDLRFNVQEKWLPTLRNLVAQINETFSRNFQEMAVAGEVSLGIYIYILISS